MDRSKRSLLRGAIKRSKPLQIQLDPLLQGPVHACHTSASRDIQLHPIFPTLKWQGEEDSEFKASLAHMATFCLERKKKKKKSATIIHINISLHKERRVNDQ